MNEKTLRILEFDKILKDITSHADSSSAKEIISSLSPLTSLKEINKLLSQTDDALIRIYKESKPSFLGVSDLLPLADRLNVEAPLNASELLAIKDILDVSKNCISFYKEEYNDSLDYLFSQLNDVPELSAKISKCIISENEIADNASPTLAALRRQQSGIHSKMSSELNRMLASNTVRKALQDTVVTTRLGRYCLPVKSECRTQVPGIIHDRSSTGSTLFIEPSIVVNLNNELNELLLQEKEEIERILESLSKFASEYTAELLSDSKALAILDLIFAKASWARANRCTVPIMNTDNIIDLKGARHPLIDKNVVVPIDVHIGIDFTSLIITGPNTGGKTVTLKTVGLLSVLACCGLPIPAAENSRVAVFKEIYADVGDEQSIEQSLSTFSAHMTHIAEILSKVDDKCLVLFDEIGAGTDPTEGAALATAILDDLLKKKITTIATTHYSELKIYAMTTPGTCNAGCEFNVETLRPTYKLLIGVPGKSNAFAISKKLGIKQELIDDAERRLSESEIRFEDLIADLDAAKRKAQEEETEIAKYKEEIASLRAEIKEERRKTADSRERILKNANEQAAQILLGAKNYAENAVKIMNRKGVTIEELRKQQAEIKEKTEERQRKATVINKNKKKRVADKPDDFKPGIFVYVLNMDSGGELLTAPDKKGDCEVMVGNFKMKQNIKNLEIDTARNATEASKKKLENRRNHSSASKIKTSKTSNISQEINIIGMTVDEGVAAIDKYLDDAFLSGITHVRIIHGMGTGALRNGVKNYLSTLSYVKDFRPGAAGEGGDGATVVELDTP